jgi:hypothetical protein
MIFESRAVEKSAAAVAYSLLGVTGLSLPAVEDGEAQELEALIEEPYGRIAQVPGGLGRR